MPLIDMGEAVRSMPPAENAQSQPSPRAGQSSAAGMFRAKMAPFIPEPGARYRRPDLVAQLPRAIAILGWGAAGVALMFIDNARPRRHGLDRFFNIYRTADGQHSEQTAAYLLVLSLSLAVGGLLVNARRMRRRDDHYDRGLIALAISSTAALLYYMLR